MKLIFAILRDSDNEPVSQALITEGYRVTRVASTGGFFRRGSTTLLVGVDDEKVKSAIEVVRSNLGPGTEPGASRATIFVVDVEHFVQV